MESPGKSIHKTSKVTLYFGIILCKYCQTTLKKSITDVRLNEEIFGGRVGVWQKFQRPEVLFKFFLLQPRQPSFNHLALGSEGSKATPTDKPCASQ